MDAIQWGNVPEWIAIGGSLGPVLFRAVQKTRIKHAQAWPAIVEELSDLSPEAIQHVLETNPRIAELVGRAWATATESAAEESRRLLARVATEAIKNPDNTDRIDELVFLQRSLSVLEPPHVRLLVLIGHPRLGTGQLAQTHLEGYFMAEDLVAAWPQAGDFILPMTALLAREGLIENRAGATYGNITAWGVSAFGRRLLALLSGEPSWDAANSAAEVAMRLERTGPVSYPELVVRNLGPATASQIRMVLPVRSDGGPILVGDIDLEPFDLGPEQEKRFALYPFTVGDHPPYAVPVRWRDESGERESHQTLTQPSE